LRADGLVEKPGRNLTTTTPETAQWPPISSTPPGNCDSPPASNARRKLLTIADYTGDDNISADETDSIVDDLLHVTA
jgi:hypothetical protein